MLMIDDDEELIRKFSIFWFCPNDGVKFVEYQPSGYRGVSGTPYFIVTRSNLEIDVENARNLKKIASPQVEFTRQLVNDMFASLPPDVNDITLVAVQCPNCGMKSVSPKLPRIIMDERQLKKFQKTLKQHLNTPTSMTASPSSQSRQGTSPLSFIWRLWYLYIILGFVLSLISVILSQILGGGKIFP